MRLQHVTSQLNQSEHMRTREGNLCTDMFAFFSVVLPSPGHRTRRRRPSPTRQRPLSSPERRKRELSRKDVETYQKDKPVRRTLRTPHGSRKTTTPQVEFERRRHGVWFKNETGHDLDIWINGGGPVAKVPAGRMQRLKMPHVDPSTTRGGCTWNATALLSTPQGLQVFPVFPPQKLAWGWHMGGTVIATGPVHVPILRVIAVISVQRHWRVKMRTRALARAAARREAAIHLQAAARGRIGRKSTQCLICLQEVMFAAMVSTTPQQRCHRVCRECALTYVDNAIGEGKLYICCPGEGCSHLMQPDLFASKQAKATYRHNMRASHRQRFDGEGDDAFLKFAVEHTRMCPACGVTIWRSAGCNHMSCRCGHDFDWGADEARVVLPTDSTTSTEGPHTRQAREMIRTFQQQPQNAFCFDCGAARPEWTSLTFATAICLECAGAHRALGVGKSRVRSLILDAIPMVDAVLLARSGGNGALAELLETREPANFHSLIRLRRGLSIAERYQSAAAHEYRRHIARMRMEASSDLAVAGEVEDAANEIEGEISMLALATDGERARIQVAGGTMPPPPADPTGFEVGTLREEQLASARDGDGERAARMLVGMERLQLMGFAVGGARAALDQFNGNVQRAALLLMGEL